MTDFDQEFRIQARLSGLVKRMLLTGLAGLVLCVVGVFGLRPALRYGLSAWSGGSPDLPALHVPSQLQALGFGAMLGVMFWTFLAFSLAALSTRALPRRQVGQALLVTFCTGLLGISLTGYTGQPLFVLPSKLERQVNAGSLSQPLLWLKDMSTDNELVDSVNYVRAQIALRDRSGTLTLRETAGPVLDYADQVLYTRRATLTPNGHPGLQAHPVGEFRAEVLYVLDRQLNGEPRSAVGLQFAKRLAQDGVSGRRAEALRTLLWRGGLLLLGMLLCRLWWVMAQRIEDIEHMLQASAPVLPTPDPAPAPAAAENAMAAD